MENIRIVKTKESIRESFFRLLKQYTFSEITIEKICKEARISRSTFYSHYSDK
ncbi:TetR/AcrR family transcriptional regulator, partial [Bacillaceae bacterium Marseille-Q3522]|nr:TetR/AcrR family transcriptional regulator [Bacillaceae bacterium Marseille-Q3522]